MSVDESSQPCVERSDRKKGQLTGIREGKLGAASPSEPRT
jgi:hypothetical protein